VNRPARSEKPSGPTRTVAYLSAAVILLLVGYLVFQAFQTSTPAIIRSEVAEDEGWTDGPHAYVPVDVWNAGESTASTIEIETRFDGTEGEPLVKRTVVGFLAGGERTRFYAVGPRGAPLTVRVVGFLEP
jgi:uncharacterized protein (TIGR02588 family)